MRAATSAGACRAHTHTQSQSVCSASGPLPRADFRRCPTKCLLCLLFEQFEQFEQFHQFDQFDQLTTTRFIVYFSTVYPPLNEQCWGGAVPACVQCTISAARAVALLPLLRAALAGATTRGQGGGLQTAPSTVPAASITGPAYKHEKRHKQIAADKSTWPCDS